MDGVLVNATCRRAAAIDTWVAKLGLDSKQASDLATQKFWDEESLLSWLDAAAVPQTDETRCAPCLPYKPGGSRRRQHPSMASAVATGKVGREYTYSAQSWWQTCGCARMAPYALTDGGVAR
jgi:hypothetical protein